MREGDGEVRESTALNGDIWVNLISTAIIKHVSFQIYWQTESFQIELMLQVQDFPPGETYTEQQQTAFMADQMQQHAVRRYEQQDRRINWWREI